MEVFGTPNSKYYHIVKEKIKNPTFPYNSKSIRIQAYCSVHCSELNATFVTLEITQPSIFACQKCLDNYNKK